MRRGARMPRQGAAIAILALIAAGMRVAGDAAAARPAKSSDGAAPRQPERRFRRRQRTARGVSPFASLAGYLAHRRGRDDGGGL